MELNKRLVHILSPSILTILVLKEIHFQESSGGDKIETLEFEKLEVKSTQCNNETETETNKEDASAKSEQLDTGLENKIKGLAITEK